TPAAEKTAGRRSVGGPHPSRRPSHSGRAAGFERALSPCDSLYQELQSGVMSNDDRQAAQVRLNDLLTIIRGMPAQRDQLARLLEEAEALERAISAFHLRSEERRVGK